MFSSVSVMSSDDDSIEAMLAAAESLSDSDSSSASSAGVAFPLMKPVAPRRGKYDRRYREIVFVD